MARFGWRGGIIIIIIHASVVKTERNTLLHTIFFPSFFKITENYFVLGSIYIPVLVGLGWVLRLFNCPFNESDFSLSTWLLGWSKGCDRGATLNQRSRLKYINNFWKCGSIIFFKILIFFYLKLILF